MNMRNFIFFCIGIFFLQLVKAQEFLESKVYTVNGVEVQSMYEMRAIDFAPKLPEEWNFTIEEASAKGFLSTTSLYGVLYVADYKGQLPLDIEEFGDDLIAEIRRRLNLQFNYITGDRYTRNGLYGMQYRADAIFRSKQRSLRAILAATDKKIVVFAALYDDQNSSAETRINRLIETIRPLN